MSPPPIPDLPTTAQLQAMLARMEHGLLERGAAVRLALLAALAGEHVLLIGPPGTAKSALARRLQHAFADARWFERLLTRFSVPEELFGPLSLKALEHDRYERLTDGYLPTAGVAFLDEVFKANSAILNALLTLLNEREFDNGTGRMRTPLVCVVGATNEVPLEDSLQAFYDRFLLRVPVGPVGDAAFDALLDLRSDAQADAGTDANADAGTDADADADADAQQQPLSRAVVQALQAAREGVALGDEARAALHALRAWTAEHGITVSDRRWRQFVQLLRVQAASLRRGSVEPLDLWLAPYAMAERAEQVPALQAWWIDHAMAAPPTQAEWLARAVTAFEQQLDMEVNLQQDDLQSGKIALARTLAATQEEGGMARIVSKTLEAKLRRHYSPVHIRARIEQVDELAQPITERSAALAAAFSQLEPRLRQHLWLAPETKRTLARRWLDALQVLQGLRVRLEAVREGFASLPVDEALAGDAPPQPVRVEAA